LLGRARLAAGGRRPVTNWVLAFFGFVLIASALTDLL
jgi:hypothetical protein